MDENISQEAFEGTGGGKFGDGNHTSENQSTGSVGESNGQRSADVGSDSNGDNTNDYDENGNTEGIAKDGGTGNGDSANGELSSNPDESGIAKLQTAQMGDSEAQASSDETTVYEGVTSTQFDESMQQISGEISNLYAASIVLVAALFACFGAICVQTLIKALTWTE